jgi:HAMP domain-containing protein
MLKKDVIAYMNEHKIPHDPKDRVDNLRRQLIEYLEKN